MCEGSFLQIRIMTIRSHPIAALSARAFYYGEITGFIENMVIRSVPSLSIMSRVNNGSAVRSASPNMNIWCCPGMAISCVILIHCQSGKIIVSRSIRGRWNVGLIWPIRVRVKCISAGCDQTTLRALVRTIAAEHEYIPVQRRPSHFDTLIDRTRICRLVDSNPNCPARLPGDIS
jgi:hypothetical protein